EGAGRDGGRAGEEPEWESSLVHLPRPGIEDADVGQTGASVREGARPRGRRDEHALRGWACRIYRDERCAAPDQIRDDAIEPVKKVVVLGSQNRGGAPWSTTALRRGVAQMYSSERRRGCLY